MFTVRFYLIHKWIFCWNIWSCKIFFTILSTSNFTKTRLLHGLDAINSFNFVEFLKNHTLIFRFSSFSEKFFSTYNFNLTIQILNTEFHVRNRGKFLINTMRLAYVYFCLEWFFRNSTKWKLLIALRPYSNRVLVKLDVEFKQKNSRQVTYNPDYFSKHSCYCWFQFYCKSICTCIFGI